MIDLFSNAKMSLGVAPHGGSQYEAISTGCLPMIWEDSIFWPFLTDYSRKNGICFYPRESRSHDYNKIQGVLNSVLTNEKTYRDLLELYNNMLAEHTYSNFVTKFTMIYNKFKEK